MEQKKSPKPKKNPLDEISPEEVAKVERAKIANESRYKVDHEWLLLAEFAKTYGWQAYRDVKNDKITTAEMMTLLAASRKLEAMDMLRDAQTAFIGAGSARTKKPSETFKKLVRHIIKDTKVDD